MANPLVSIITPTCNRPAFLERLHSYVRAQKYSNWEWRILDDSRSPNNVLSKLDNGNIIYEHTSDHLSIGEKRNRLIDTSKGKIIVHFDDDDFYGSQYIEVMIKIMEQNKADFIRLSGFFVLSASLLKIGYYRIFLKEGPAYTFNSKSVKHVQLDDLNIPFIHLNYGWTYVYLKSVWEHCPFRDINTFEDREFVLSARKSFDIKHFEDTFGMCCHTVHPTSSSQCFPQFLIPLFLAKRLNAEFTNYLDSAEKMAEFVSYKSAAQGG